MASGRIGQSSAHWARVPIRCGPGGPVMYTVGCLTGGMHWRARPFEETLAYSRILSVLPLSFPLRP